MSTLFLINMSLGPENSGPSAHLMTAVIDAVASRGEPVKIISRASEMGLCDSVKSLVEAGAASHISIHCDPPAKSNIVARYLNDAQFFSKASRLAKSMAGIDRVFVQSCVNPAAAVRSARRACPRARIVYNVQDIYPEAALCRGIVSTTSASYRIVNGLQRWAYLHSDEIITISEDMRGTILESGVDPSRVSVIHNWNYSDDFDPIDDADNTVLKELALPADAFRVVYAGNIGTLQSVETLVESAALLCDHADIHFIVAGDGARMDTVRGIADDKQLANVHFLGRQPSSLAPMLYSMAHANVISLIPGCTRAALPSKTAICLAVGKPIVLSCDLDSHYAEIMRQSGACAICAPSDPRAMADAILELRSRRHDGGETHTAEVLGKYFSHDRNSQAYADIILGA